MGRTADDRLNKRDGIHECSVAEPFTFPLFLVDHHVTPGSMLTRELSFLTAAQAVQALVDDAGARLQLLVMCDPLTFRAIRPCEYAAILSSLPPARRSAHCTATLEQRA